MAHISVNAPAHNSILRVLAAPFVAVGNFLIAIGEANSRAEKANRLQQMSDAELAARGIKREDIVRHVFKDIYYV
ncbi:hypothetical protein NBRC116590_18610 [Pelagimonas sp. KU-00592-HH]|uniref:hypothetical protein n=1 Tax=Roseobacteraceae TaxID=2854170 RepID=UPI0020CD32DF|nr:hypothetical protein [Shimia sp. CNT1-13L.2]MCP9480502.1 hypothetical protein [Shimia sp. CNT1-13L.2]